MKKTLLFALCALLLPIVANAYNFSVDGIYYNKNSDGTSVTVTYKTTSYNSYSGSIVIPSTVTYNDTEYSVTSIGSSAFNSCSGLTSVTIPNSVTSIVSYAFSGCSGLTSVTIPNSVTSIGEYAFSGCIGLTSVTIGNSVTRIGSYAFYRCGALTSVTIPNSVTSIGEYAFSGCSSLTSVTIPNSVTSIGSYAFRDCSGLTSVTIPNSVTSIGQYAFYRCSALTSVTLNANDIVSKTYSSSSNLGTIFGSQVKEYVLGDDVKGIGNYAFSGCSSLTSVTIPNSVTSIGEGAFSGCSGLTKAEFASIESFCKITFGNSLSNPLYYAKHLYINGQEVIDVVIPNSVTSIVSYAFSGCSGLTSVTIPNSVTSIGEYAFSGCIGLTSVTIGNSVTSIGSYAFRDCSGLTSVTIGNSVTSIGNYAFSYCTGLTSVTIPNSVTSIGERAFLGCSKMTSITIPNSVTSIGNYAFEGCSGLKSVTIPNSVTSIGDSAFSGCSGLTSVTIPNSVTRIGEDAFAYCSGLTKAEFASIESLCKIAFVNYASNPLYYAHHLYIDGQEVTDVVIPNSVTSIGNYAFEGCSGLKSVTIPNSVTSIGDSAFSGCSGLTSVTIPNSVTSIGNYAFSGCSGLTSVTIPNSVTSIGEYAFSGCSGLTSVTLNANDIVSKTYSDSSNLGTIFGSQVKEYVLGDDVKGIGYYAFSGCSGLTSVTIPNSVTSIGNSAFYRCSGLTSVTIPNSVTSIGSYAFYKCTSLTSVTIPNSVTSIGECAFSRCSGLTSVTIPNSLTSIGNYAFESCSGLTSIKVNTGNPVYDSRYNCNAIIETKTNTLIQGCKNTIIPEGVTSIGEDAFVLCTGLTSIYIPSSVTSISDEAFAGCTGLQAVYCDATNIPTTGKNVFRNIASATLYVPESMVSKYRYKTPWSDFSTISPFPYFNVDGIYYNIYTTGTNVSVTYNPTSPSGYLSIVEIPSTVKYNDKQYIVNRIGTSAFSGCSELTSVKVPESVISIGESAFYGCTALTSITVPNSVTSIGRSAFTGCPLQTIVNRGDNDIDKSTFSDRVYLHTQLYVPEGTVWDYIFNTGWGEFHNIREFANNADNIRNNAVYLIADHSGRNFPVYDRATKSLKNVAYTLNLDDNDAGACWRIIKDGSDTYLYNIGAGMYAAYDVENKLSLSIAPSAVDIKVTKEGTMINGKPAMLVVNKSVTPDPTYITGDANGNGVVEIGDVTSVLTLMATPDATGYNNKAADANGNGEIEIGDVTTILTIMAGN